MKMLVAAAAAATMDSQHSQHDIVIIHVEDFFNTTSPSK